MLIYLLIVSRFPKDMSEDFGISQVNELLPYDNLT